MVQSMPHSYIFASFQCYPQSTFAIVLCVIFVYFGLWFDDIQPYFKKMQHKSNAKSLGE